MKKAGFLPTWTEEEKSNKTDRAINATIPWYFSIQIQGKDHFIGNLKFILTCYILKYFKRRSEQDTNLLDVYVKYKCINIFKMKLLVENGNKILTSYIDYVSI